MRGIEKLIIVAFLGLVALAVWNVRDWLSQHLPTSAQAPSIGPVSGFGATTPKSKSASSKAIARLRTKEPALRSEDVTVVDVPYKGQPFPEPKDLPNGITGSEIRATYGNPSAHVTVSQGGQIVEKYYYLNQDHTRYTIASLADGRVISANSLPL